MSKWIIGLKHPVYYFNFFTFLLLQICGKGFCHRQSLITHSTLHTGIKPYVCENCDHAFSCVGNLLKHRKTHSECNLIPLTTHRVINPITKQKVRVNTPANSKLKEVERNRKLQKNLELLYNTQTTEEEYDRDKIKEHDESKVKIEDVADQKLDGENSVYENNDGAIDSSDDPINTSLSTINVATNPPVHVIEQKTQVLENFEKRKKIGIFMLRRVSWIIILKLLLASQDYDIKIEETSVVYQKIDNSSIYQNFPSNHSIVDVATNSHVSDITKSKRKQRIPRSKITTRELQIFIKERKIGEFR